MSKLSTRKTWGGKLVIGVPFVWLLLLFLVPFFIILKISFAEQALSIPPFTPLFNEETGALQVSLQNYKDIFADLGSSLGALLNPFDGGNQGDNIYLLNLFVNRLSDGIRDFSGASVYSQWFVVSDYVTVLDIVFIACVCVDGLIGAKWHHQQLFDEMGCDF